jgi:predicted acylesterase/phospholipase RssA
MSVSVGGQPRHIGLALSGGGFRATIFHLGVLRRLQELGLLKKIDILSSVSGGSITAGIFAAMPTHPQNDFIAFQRRVLSGIFMSPRGWWMAALLGAIFLPLFAGAWWTPLVWLALVLFPWDRFQVIALLFQAVFRLGRTTVAQVMQQPRFMINTTCLNTGSGWVYSRDWVSGDSATIFGFGNPPRVDADPARVRLASAIGASACVPGLFYPYTLRLRERIESRGLQLRRVKMVDGGAYDNQGIWVFLPSMHLFPERLPVDYVIGSDAAYPMATQRRAFMALWPMSSLQPLLRTASIWEERSRDEAYEILDRAARPPTGLLRQYALFYIGGHSVQSARHATGAYGLPPSFADALAHVRTDLDHFSSLEIRALMYHGYTLANHRILNYCSEILKADFPALPAVLAPLAGKAEPFDWQDLLDANGAPGANLPPLDDWAAFNEKLSREHPRLLRTAPRWRRFLALRDFDESGADRTLVAAGRRHLERAGTRLGAMRTLLRLWDHSWLGSLAALAIVAALALAAAIVAPALVENSCAALNGFAAHLRGWIAALAPWLR